MWIGGIMARLINIEDAALLKTVMDGGLSAKALWRRINAQPTIDAVPIAFIKSEIKNTQGAYPYSLRILLDTWEREKG